MEVTQYPCCHHAYHHIELTTRSQGWLFRKKRHAGGLYNAVAAGRPAKALREAFLHGGLPGVISSVSASMTTLTHEAGGGRQPCVTQYVLFVGHMTTASL